LGYIEANPLRAKLVEHAGEYRWSSFASHGNGAVDELLDHISAYESLGAYPAARRRRWSAYVHQTPDVNELAAIRRSDETGLPYGQRSWVDKLCRRLKLDLTIRPRGRPRKVEE
jgi:putative transposase